MTKNSSSGVDTTTTTTTATIDTADARYACNDEELNKLRKSAPWQNDAVWFKSVVISPTAIMKMMTHCNSGVEKGIKAGGRAIEVMGLCIGRPDPTTPTTLVVTDVFPLPIEGFETRVIADDEDVVNYMIALGESLESTRKERFMGWYHSHPFDVGPNSHCFLSSTDMTTQLQWQRSEDPHGNPFLAIVVDPLRSLAKNRPELKAFRAYPPEYSSPVTNQCPDGSIVELEKTRLEKWGSCWGRYYELQVDYFMSKSSRNVMDILTKNFLWMRNLGTTPSLEPENRQGYPARVAAISDNLSKLDVASLVASSGKGGGGGGGTSSMEHTTFTVPPPATSASSTPSVGNKNEDRNELIDKACDEVVDFATDKIHENIVQVAKKDLFS